MATETTEADLLVIYGTQTGNSESISQRIQNDIKKKFPDVRVQWVNASKHSSVQFDKIRYIVAVISSTGSGEAPEDSLTFFRFLNRQSDTFLSHAKYALLGLGDSNYDTFQATPKKLEAKFIALGAQSFYNTGAADDGTGLEDVVEPWIDGLYPAIQTLISTHNDSTPAPSSTANNDANATIDTNQSSASSVSTTTPTEAKPTTVDTGSNSTTPTVTSTTEKTSEIKKAAPRKKIVVKSIPDFTDAYLSIKWKDTGDAVKLDDQSDLTTLNVTRPETRSDTHKASLRSTQRLTDPSASHTTLEFEIEVQPNTSKEEPSWHWVPGDAFGIVCPVLCG